MSFATSKMLDDGNLESKEEKYPISGFGQASMVTQRPIATQRHIATQRPIATRPSPHPNAPSSLNPKGVSLATPWSNLPASLTNPHIPYMPLNAHSFNVAGETSNGVSIGLDHHSQVTCEMVDDRVNDTTNKIPVGDAEADALNSTNQLSHISREFRRHLGQVPVEDLDSQVKSVRKTTAKRLDAAINEYQENFCALDVGMSNHRDEIHKLKKSLSTHTDTVNSDMQSTRTNVKRLENVVKNLRGNDGAQNSSLHTGLLAQKAAIELHAKNSSAAVASLQDQVQKAGSAMAQQTANMNSLQTRMGKHGSRVDSIDDGLRTHKTVLESHDSKISSMMTKLEKLDMTCREMQKRPRVENNDKKVNSIGDGLLTHKTLLQSHDAKISSILATLDDIKPQQNVSAQVESLHHGVLAQKASIESVHANSTLHQATIRQLQSELSSMKTGMQTHETKMRTLEDHLKRNINPTKLLPHQVLNAAVDAYRSRK